MELSGETVIDATREQVWAALNDPAVLARCIEGVETLEALGDNRFAGVLNAKVGPVKARFTGEVALTELDPPNRYVLVGEGKGGVAGFAKGSADVQLADAPGGGTRLSYVATSQVGGKLAQLGTRLIEGTAKAYAESFFAAFKREVEAPADAAAAETVPAPADAASAPPPAPEPVPASPPAAAGLPGWAWVAGLVVLVLLALLLLLR
jgi:carbon monoxide dehydrogenase subunit G